MKKLVTKLQELGGRVDVIFHGTSSDTRKKLGKLLGDGTFVYGLGNQWIDWYNEAENLHITAFLPKEG